MREESQRRALIDLELALAFVGQRDARDDLAARALRAVEPALEIDDERLEERLERLGREDLVAMRSVRQRDA